MVALRLASCSLVFRHSADPLILLDFNGSGPPSNELTVSVYKQEHAGALLKQSFTSKDISVPQGEAEFDLFLEQLACVISSIRASLLATEAASGPFYGKGSFHPGGSGDSQPKTNLNFRYRWGTPSSQAAIRQNPWEQDWMKTPRGDFPEGFELSTGEIPMLGQCGEPRLNAAFLALIAPKETRHSKPRYYRICFCCLSNCSPTSIGAARVLCWLHPEWDADSTEATAAALRVQAHRLELAAINNYLCVFERAQQRLEQLGQSGGNSEVDRVALLFLALESGSWAAADWLMSGPGGCGVDAVDRWGDTALARCCVRGGNPRVMAFLFGHGAQRQRRDADGNSAMHRLVAAFRRVAATEVRSALAALAGDLAPQQLAAWLAEENLAGERPAALASCPEVVAWLLERLLADTDGQRPAVNVSEALDLLRCSSGYSLAHTAAAFDSLKGIGDVVTGKLGASSWQNLLSSAEVKLGPLRGYTPMHAACQEGVWHSVSYLLLHGCPTPSSSAIDLAIREGHLCDGKDFFKFADALLDAFNEDAVLEALRTIDQAGDCLTHPVNSFEQDCGDRVVRGANFRLQRATFRLAVDDNDSRDPLLQALKDAWKSNSAAPLRTLARDRVRPGSLMVECEDPQTLPKIQRSLLGGDGSNTSMPPFGLLGLALCDDKWRLAGDLLPMRQLDLLPACLCVMLTIRLLDRVRPTEARSAGSNGVGGIEQLPVEMMHDLYQQAKRTFCAALQRLYRGAVTEEQKNLLFNYLGGRFHHPLDSKSPCNFGPLFADNVFSDDAKLSVFDLLMLTNEPDLLALQGVTEYVDRLMSSPMHFCCHRCPGAGGDRQDGPTCLVIKGPIDVLSAWWPQEADWLKRHLPRGVTPKLSMVITACFNLVVICLIGFYAYIIGAENNADAQSVVRALLLICSAFYIANEFQDLCLHAERMSCRRKLAQYFAYQWNWVDIAAVTFLLTGLIWNYVSDPNAVGGSTLSFYDARLLLAVSFLLYCTRMLSNLGYYERLGLYISIIKTTIVLDVIPFLIVSAFFVVSFGFLFVCLLFPGGRVYPAGQTYAQAKPKDDKYSLSVYTFFTEIFQRPMLAHFGEYRMDYLLTTCRSNSSDDVNCPHPLGNDLYTRLVLFVYMLIVSIVLVNVLIAKLSLTVSREDERARVIWRGFRAQLLREFSGNAGPPLFRLCTGLWRLGRWTCNWCFANGRTAVAGAATAPGAAAQGLDGGWPVIRKAANGNTDGSRLSVSMDDEGVRNQQQEQVGAPRWTPTADLQQAPEDYRKFLWLQAMQLRNFRHTFAQQKIAFGSD